MPRQDKVFVCFQKAEDDTHKLYIYDDVTAYGTFNWSTWSYEESETSAKYFQEQLAAIPDTATIELHINSNGGSVKEGVAIYSQLKQKNCKKVGYVDGVAYSVAFLILQACDERVMGLGTSALIHNMWMSVDGNAKELRKAADDLDTLMESNRQIFLEKSNLEEQQLIDMMEAETSIMGERSILSGTRIFGIWKRKQKIYLRQQDLRKQGQDWRSIRHIIFLKRIHFHSLPLL